MDQVYKSNISELDRYKRQNYYKENVPEHFWYTKEYLEFLSNPPENVLTGQERSARGMVLSRWGSYHGFLTENYPHHLQAFRGIIEKIKIKEDRM